MFDPMYAPAQALPALELLPAQGREEAEVDAGRFHLTKKTATQEN